MLVGMIERSYDAAVTRWFRCVERGRHTFPGNGNRCVECGAVQPGPQVKIVRGVVDRRGKK